MIKLHGNAAKMYALSAALSKKGVKPVTHKRGTAEWWAWKGWREKNGLGTAYMQTAPTFGVPQDMPPEGSLDTALDEAQAGTASKRFAT